VLLYRDTNAWCPFCERVWLALEEKGIDYDTMFIDLRDKPDWFKQMVPTALVPAAQIDGELVWESLDILLKLEEVFPTPALLPSPGTERECILALSKDLEDLGAAGYRPPLVNETVLMHE
jgi:glutathione S-transferase